MPGRIFSLLPRPSGRFVYISPPPLSDIDLQQLHFCRTIPKIRHLYLTTRHHCRRHGLGMSDSPAFLQGLNKPDSMSIPVDRLVPPYQSNNHKFGIASKNGVTVIGPSSFFLRDFHMSFPEGGHCPFHYALACHIIRNKPGKDPSRVADGKVHNILATVLNLRLTFGFTREQRSDYSKDHHAGVKLPLINVKHFKDCPPHLRRGLIYIMETATKLARRKVLGAFSNPLRSKVYAKRFNDKLVVNTIF